MQALPSASSRQTTRTRPMESPREQEEVKPLFWQTRLDCNHDCGFSHVKLNSDVTLLVTTSECPLCPASVTIKGEIYT